jgi:hypothetical protein
VVRSSTSPATLNSQPSTFNRCRPHAPAQPLGVWPGIQLDGQKTPPPFVIRHSEFDIPNDLFLAGNSLKQHLLIEFKRPSDAVGRDAEAQANEYADTLTGRLGMSLQILIIGGEADPKLQDEYTGKKTSFAAYRAVIAAAHRQLDWLLDQLNRPPA